MPRGTWRTALVALGPTVLVFAIGTGAARADIALCAAFPTPSTEAQALRRAPFAFDGVVVGGRQANEPTRGPELVSPLTFRVTRWIKGEPSGIALPSGAEEVHIWDGRYARLPDELLKRYSARLDRRVPGEIMALPGQTWRVYGTNENGVNFTCTNMLGSHPVRASAPVVPSSPASLAPNDSSPPAARWSLGVVLGLVVVGLVALLALAATGPSGSRDRDGWHGGSSRG
jgi:hypothetical protein